MSAARVYIYRDKHDFRPLPLVPQELEDEFKQVIGAMMNNAQLEYFEKMDAYYSYLERYNAFVATFTVCTKGCNHCCKNDVLITRLEAEYIHKKGNGKYSLDVNQNTTAGHRTPCPFLASDGACSIYTSRPFNCRTFHTLDDPKYCKTNEPHQVYGHAGGGYGAGVYKAFSDWLKSIHSGRYLPRDIRDWFPSI